MLLKFWGFSGLASLLASVLFPAVDTFAFVNPQISEARCVSGNRSDFQDILTSWFFENFYVGRQRIIEIVYVFLVDREILDSSFVLGREWIKFHKTGDREWRKFPSLSVDREIFYSSFIVGGEWIKFLKYGGRELNLIEKSSKLYQDFERNFSATVDSSRFGRQFYRFSSRLRNKTTIVDLSFYAKKLIYILVTKKLKRMPLTVCLWKFGA